MLHPVIAVPPSPHKPRLKQQLKINKRLKSDTLKELVITVVEKLVARRGPDEIVKPFNHLCAIKSRITLVINDEIFKRKEEKLKDEFKAIFGPVPHFNELPTDVEARIKLKDPDKTIKTHSYPCPRKYKEA